MTDGYNLTTRDGIQRIDFEEVREPAEIVAAWSGFVGGRELLVVIDYLDGDRYFRTAYPEHNLIRCRTQLKLVAEMEKVFDQMHAVIQKYC